MLDREAKQLSSQVEIEMEKRRTAEQEAFAAGMAKQEVEEEMRRLRGECVTLKQVGHCTTAPTIMFRRI